MSAFDLQRKMGDLSSARRIFEQAWPKDGTRQSFAGLAEVNRQTGRLSKAINKYTWLLDKMEIGDRSCKVYQISLSSLYRVLGNRDTSRLILEKPQSVYKHDPSIQLELAKVFKLLGDSARAEELYCSSFAKLHQTDQLAAQLYETALVTREEVATSQEITFDVLPEFRTLARCNFMLRRIIEGNIDALRDIPSRSRGGRMSGQARTRWARRRWSRSGWEPRSRKTRFRSSNTPLRGGPG